QVGRQKIPVVRTPTKKMPSKLESRSTSARYIVSAGGRRSIVFIGAQSAWCNSRGLRCGHAQMQPPVFAEIFQRLLAVLPRLRFRRRSYHDLNCRRGSHVLRERHSDTPRSPHNADTARRERRSVPSQNTDVPTESPRTEKGPF